MSKKIAQSVVDDVYNSHGISLTSYNLNEILLLQEKLEEFLNLEIEPEELKDPSTHSEDDFFSDEELELGEEDML